MSPDAWKRVMWNIVGTLLIIWDMITIPMSMFGEWQLVQAVGVMSMFYWIADMFMNFFIGVQVGMLVEMRLAKIATAYIRGWFFLDMSIIAIDVTLYMNRSSDTGASTLKLVRLLRLSRLLRVRKMMELYDEFLLRLKSEYTVHVIRLANQLIAILVLNHYIACAWYGIAVLGNEPVTWMTGIGLVEEDSLTLRYSMSVHWSLTQFTPATNDINPRNALER